VWKGRAQIQRVSVMEKEGMSGRKAGASCEEKSVGDREEVKKSRRR